MASVDRSRQASLDALRVAAVFGVVAIHAGFYRSGEPLAFYLDEAGRFAVPVFFILSAYFWRPELVTTPLHLARRAAGRVWLALVVFLILNTGLAYLLGRDFTLDLSPAGLLLMVWNGDPVSHYLWFLTALVVGTLITGLGLRYLGLRASLLLSLAAYALGCAIGAYGETLLGEEPPIWLFRNGLLFAPLFMLIGVVLRQQRDRVERIPFVVLAIAVPLTLALQIAEGRLLLGRTAFGHDYGLATLPYAVAMVLLFMRLPIRGQIWIVLGRASFGAYLVHFPLLMLVDQLGWPLSLAEVIVDCAAVSLLLAVTYQLIASRFGQPVVTGAPPQTDTIDP